MIAIKNLFQIHTVLRDVFIRFPLPVLLALTAVVVSWLLTHELISFNKAIIPLFYLSIAINFVAQIVFKLFAESENWSLKKYHISSIGLLVLIIIYAQYLIYSQHIVPFIFLIVSLLLSIIFAPYIRDKSSMNSVWYFNYQTGSAIFFAAVASIILGAGLSLILLSVTYLFDIDLDKILYADIWILSAIGFVPVYILENISQQFDYNDESCGFPKGIRFISNYLLVPLMMAYMLVLYAYFIKIILQWELPKGYLGWMIICFGAIGILTKLLTYPISDTGNKLLTLFDRYFYKALIVPTLMLFFAITIRITDYGVTEQRYAVVMLGIWFVVLIALSIFYKEKFHIKHVPMVLAALSLLAAYGPWSAGSVSLNSQMKRFESLLIDNKLLVDGKITINKDADSISYEDRRSLYSTADYLSKTRWRKDSVRADLQAWSLSGLNIKKDLLPKLTARKLLSQLNVEYAGRNSYADSQHEERFYYSNNQNLKTTLINISGYDFITHSNFYNYQGKHRKKQLTLKDGNREEEMTASVVDNNFEIVRYDGDRIQFDLSALVFSLKKQGIKKITDKNTEKMIIEKVSDSGHFKAKLVLENLSGKMLSSSRIKITNVKYVLMVGINKK